MEAIAEDPTRYLVLDPDRAANLLELVVIDRPQGPAVMHADADESEISTIVSKGALTVTATHGNEADGTPITDEMVEAMADEAERGYDVEEIIRRRRGGRPPMGSAASTVESVRLDPELKRDLLLHAAEAHISVSEAIRRAIGQYLRAS
ncbi:MAG: ribbon-helix-helix domain-containing protein [Solirubrobacteraceae bacterium]